MSDSRLEALETYFRLMGMNGAVQVYRAAMNAGIPQALAGGAASAGEVAERCRLKSEPTRLVLDALAATGLLRASGGKFELASVAKFVMGPYRDLGDLYWSHLPTLLATGEPLIAVEQAAQGEAFYQAQAAALEWMVAPSADAASSILVRRAPHSVLDVGAGAATWSLAIARRDSSVKITALDRPAVLQVASAAAARAGLAERFTALPGDFHTVELAEESFDLAIVANVAHLESPDGNISLLKNLRRVLKKGGAVAVIDVVPGSPAGELSRALYALGLALRTRQGRTYTREELDRCLAASGFAAGTWTALDAVPHTLGMVVAEK